MRNGNWSSGRLDELAPVVLALDIDGRGIGVHVETVGVGLAGGTEDR